jgi:hypothetical protein
VNTVSGVRIPFSPPQTLNFILGSALFFLTCFS